MKRFLISPPFGNWVSHPKCTRVLGSFTWERRPGLLYHTLRSFRPVSGGWINQIGLRNKGIRSVRFNPKHIYSLVGLADGDWERMLDYCPAGLKVEINLGCPNVHEYGIHPKTLAEYCKKFTVIAKLSPGRRVYDVADMCMENGVSYLHCSNTIPTPQGGISGLPLLNVNMMIVCTLADSYPGKIIAGGGIYDSDYLRMYAIGGATHFSLSTVWMTPWRVSSIMNCGIETAEVKNGRIVFR